MNGLRQQNIPPRCREVLWVEPIKGGERQSFIIYSPSLFGLWTHYIPGSKHTRPCYENHELCEGGHSEETLRWKGYVHAWSEKRREPVFVQLTPGACWSWLDTLAEGVGLRGQKVTVWRTKSDKGRLLVSVENWSTHRNPQTLPPPLDPLPSICHMWRMKPLAHLLHSSLVTDKADIPDDGREA